MESYSNPGSHIDSNASSTSIDLNNTSDPKSEGESEKEQGGERVITSIRATDLALSLRRIPAGFQVVVRHTGLEWRTENIPVLMGGNVTEWTRAIPIPSELSAKVSLEVQASFELQPVLGNGERLQELAVTVNELLHHSKKDLPFTFLPEDGDVISPCSSLSVIVEWWDRKKIDSLSSKVLEPYCSTGARRQLEDATDKGHSGFLRYQRHGEPRDLGHAMKQFQHALGICPQDDPCIAAVQSNMAMAKFIHCRIHNADASLEIPLVLYRNALTLRPVGHPDRPSTLIQLAAVHLARFEKLGKEVDTSQAEAYLREVVGLSSADSYENPVARFMLQVHVEAVAGAVPTGVQSSVGQDPPLRLTVVELWSLSLQLLNQFNRSGEVPILEQAITTLEAFVSSASLLDDQFIVALETLATALQSRYSYLEKPSDLEAAISRQWDAVNLIPDGHPTRPRLLGKLGAYLFARFECLGNPSDLEEAISMQQDSVNLTPNGRPDRLGRLNNLGNSFAARFKHLGEPSDLEKAIQTQREVVDLIPDGQPIKPICLSNLGNSLRTRFNCLGEPCDLEEAVSKHRAALDLIPDGHPDKFHFLNNLGNSLFSRFERVGDVNDLEEAISKQQSAVHLTPDHHPVKLLCLNNLGNSFITRFERLGELSDLEEGISRQRDAVRLTPNSHPEKPAYLNNLGHSLFRRFERLKELPNLQEAISKQQEAVTLLPDGHPVKPECLINLGNSFIIRFRNFGDLIDLEEAISRHKDAVGLTPDDHPLKPSHLSNLGASFSTRFERLGETNDLMEAISTHQKAVGLTPNDHPRRPHYLSNLANSFGTRFKHFGDLSDLEEAVSGHRDAVDLTHNNHPTKSLYLNNLSASLLTRFQHIGDIGDLEDAISKQWNAVELTPDGHSEKPMCFSNLAAATFIRFERFGDLKDLEEAILRKQDAINLIPDGHPDKIEYIDNLNSFFLIRFDRLGELRDLEKATSGQQDVVNLTPNGHPQKPGYLNTLGNSFYTRFERFGEVNDIEEAISKQEETLDLVSDGHPDRPHYLNNLGDSLSIRFSHLGELADLEKAILIQREAVALVPDDHPRRPKYLNSLGLCLIARFNYLRDLNDIEEAMSAEQNAVDLTPDDDPVKPRYSSNLAYSFIARFNHLGNLSDLEEATSRYRNAVDRTPDGHPDKHSLLNSLGVSFSTRFVCLRDPMDLEEAISRQRDAIRLTPEGYPNVPGYASNLGCSLSARFECLGELADLEEAIVRHQDAVDLTPDGHPEKTTYLVKLGQIIKIRFQCLGVLSDLERALVLFSHAACVTTGAIATRFSASQQWIATARLLGHHSLLRAYSVAIILLPQLAWIGLPLTHRYRELAQGADVVREAAAAALEAGHPETAIEWLEQGRSVVWGELFQLRGSYDELLSAYPDHARRLRELSAALERASIAREKFLTLPVGQPSDSRHRRTPSLQQEADNQRKFAIKRDKLLQDIRQLPGFDRFLLQKEFSQLRASAHSGPVVILNAAETRCDALVVLADLDHAIHVPLPNFAPGRSKALQTSLKNLVRHARDISRDKREGRPVPQERFGQWTSILSPLWKLVVKPILDALAFSIPGDLSRIFWCPTGPFIFLPIHAAGFYDPYHSQPGYKVYDFAISSYVPTLSILAPSSEPGTPLNGALRLLVVPQPLSDGHRVLPGVAAELGHIRKVVASFPLARTTLTESSLGTIDEVLSLMKDSDWVHFACHGIQDGENPAESGLCLADRRRLKLSDMISLSRPHGGLAFLSACQTAKGDEELSDEAIHVAAGMLFAGYGGVVGTMWSISDRFAPDVARDVYEQLFRGGGTPDYREAAGAVHFAVGRLRENTEASFQDWLPFIHVGL